MIEKIITQRENFLRAIERRYPEWIPIEFEMFPAVWKKHGSKLVELARRHPLIFSESG